MNHQLQPSADQIRESLLLRGGLALLILLGWCIASANGQSQPENSVSRSSMHVRHILGFESVPRNAAGELSIVDNCLRFQRKGNPAAQIRISLIQNISLGEQDKQVGGVPMMLGKAAVPFGGGRVVSLFSHKKYDSLTIEYLDSNGGFHGAIFRLAKGKARTFKNDLLAHGAKIAELNRVYAQRAPEESPSDAQQWSIQVDRVDPAGTTLDASFSDAIYENLLHELSKSKQFKQVFRSGDQNANGVPGMLVLKTLVEKYSPGSETKRAVTTIAGATKLKLHIQLLTGDGRILLDHSVDGNVRFFGDNFGATNKVARSTVKTLRQSGLPARAAVVPHVNPGEACL